ncbi:MAG: PQQ-dependent sugar dehydrogenase [Reyranellaceae bacterium]
MMRVLALGLAAVVAATLAAMPALAQNRTVATQAARLEIRTVAQGLDHPWGVAELPDGNLLVTERAGRLRLISPQGQVSAPIAGVPQVQASGQGGLLDVTLAPDFAQSRLVYLSYSEPGEGGAGTSVARGRLDGNALRDVQVIFRQQPKVSGPNHFGSRIVFAPDGKLFITTGERFKFDPSQDLNSHLGKVIRVNPDGSVPPDNPFVGRAGARPEIWSYGHRNIQGAAINPRTGALWINEHGPRGGDEVNIPEPGKNYGWPLVSWGDHYSGQPIAKPPTRPDLVDAVYQWTPVIAVCGMTFYDSDAVPQWRGQAFVGGLVYPGIVRLILDGDRVASEERIDLGTRVRAVKAAADGALLVLTDSGDGAVLRLVPQR